MVPDHLLFCPSPGSECSTDQPDPGLKAQVGHISGPTERVLLWVQTLGATDWETFQVDGRFFLAVANSQKVSERGPSLYSINSTVYELNMLTQTFMPFQDILTHR